MGALDSTSIVEAGRRETQQMGFFLYTPGHSQLSAASDLQLRGTVNRIVARELSATFEKGMGMDQPPDVSRGSKAIQYEGTEGT
jgi:hypothetical protein